MREIKFIMKQKIGGEFRIEVAGEEGSTTANISEVTDVNTNFVCTLSLKGVVKMLVHTSGYLGLYYLVFALKF